MTTWLGRRPAALPLLILGAGLIAVAAGPTPAEGAWAGIPDPDVVQNVIVVVVLLVALIGLLMLILARGGARQEGQQRKRSWLPSIIALLIVFLFSMADFRGELTEVEETDEAPPVVADQVVPEVEPGQGFEPTDGAALLALVLVALGVLWWARRGLAPPGHDADTDADVETAAIGSAVERARGDLLDESDPRAAVLLAYRNLEVTLESLDLPRRPSETPSEHLRRALPALSVTEAEQSKPLVELAELYARARFSNHRITAVERDRAAEALGRARRRLVSS